MAQNPFPKIFLSLLLWICLELAHSTTPQNSSSSINSSSTSASSSKSSSSSSQKSHHQQHVPPSSSAAAEESESVGQISFKRVAGCPDLESFQRASSSSFDFLTMSNGQLLSRIACLCGPRHVEDGGGENENGEDAKEEEKEMASITCIYGSTLADLEHTIALAKTANKDIERIVLNHVDIGDGVGLLDLLLLGTNSSLLQHLEIKKCRGGSPLNLSTTMTTMKDNNNNSNNNFDSLKTIVIEECEMGEMPSALLARAPRVQSISLANNKIQRIAVADLAAGKQSLENLNLAGNLLYSGSIEEGSLGQLGNQLKSLEIGEHNFGSAQLLAEIGQLTNLESLDISQLDGIDSAARLAEFRGMARLKRLIMSGCNLRVLNASSFRQFPALEWLDLRVNLIERLESGCFAGLENLRFLSLAGNFLKELPADQLLWRDVPQLEQLDLGWNDFRVLNKTTFAGIGPKLERLNLRNNEALRSIEMGTFDPLASGLTQLNLSATSIGRIGRGLLNLPRLKELDLSTANLSSVDPSAFDAFKGSLELLSLAGNSLRRLDHHLLADMDALKAVDLSDNPWLCDERMQRIAALLDDSYKLAAAAKRDFELRHSERTTCDRPFTRRGQSIFELVGVNASELAYNERVDTTTTTMAVTTGMSTDENGTAAAADAAATIDWKAITLLVGSPVDEHINITALLEEENAKEDAKRPRYDINTVTYGQKSATNKREANTWLSGVIVTLLVIVTAFCIIIVARRRKTENEVEEKAAKIGREEEEFKEEVNMEEGREESEQEEERETEERGTELLANSGSSREEEEESPTAMDFAMQKPLSPSHLQHPKQQQLQHRQQQQQATITRAAAAAGTTTDLEQNCATTSF